MRADLSEPGAVLRRYYLFQALAGVGFVSPIFALFVLRDLSFGAYGTLSAVYSLVLVFGELPTGYLGDRAGRRDTLVASNVAMAASLLGFVVADSFASYFVLYVVWGLGLALTSGTGSAWLYEVLESTIGSGKFTAIRGRGTAIARWSAGAAMILGAILYDVDPTYPFLAAGVVLLAGAFVLWTLPRTEQFVRGTEQSTVRETVDILRARLLAPELRSFVVLVGLVFGVAGAANGYVQPAVVEVLEGFELPFLGLLSGLPALKNVFGGFGVTAASGLGPLYASFAVAGAAASYAAGPLERRFGLRRVLVVAGAVLLVTLAAPLAVPLAVFLTFYVTQSLQHLLGPMVERYVNDRTGDAGRATILSAVSMVFGLARAPFAILAGLAAESLGPVGSFPALGALLVVLVAPLVAVGSPLPRSRAEDAAE